MAVSHQHCLIERNGRNVMSVIKPLKADRPSFVAVGDLSC